MRQRDAFQHFIGKLRKQRLHSSFEQSQLHRHQDVDQAVPRQGISANEVFTRMADAVVDGALAFAIGLDAHDVQGAAGARNLPFVLETPGRTAFG